jgi:4-alpha-glucanotransferase
MRLTRGSGILLHPTSLPGPHGSGDVGREAEAFLGWLAAAGQQYWQMLPLGPGGYGNSPYSSLSAFGSNPLLISPERLVERGWLSAEALASKPSTFSDRRIDFAASTAHRMGLLAQAAQTFFERGSPQDRRAFEEYRAKHSEWLPDYALFMALNEKFGGREWSTWDAELARRKPEALEAARRELAPAVRLHEFTQWAFVEQWSEVRRHAAAKQIKLIGDIPIFVAHHSVDVWAHPEVFELDASGNPTVVAGVPPDYFSKTGQRWGNPLYRWDALAKTGYRWWLDRIKAVLEYVDIARIDHFRGFAGYWEIPASEPTAVNGNWKPGPGTAFFETVRRTFGGQLPIIAEDLGLITPDVLALRDQFELPGMKVLQFAFGSGHENAFLPHNFTQNFVVYTGTHDNDTTRGWYQSTDDAARHHVRRYLGTDGSNIAWDLMRIASESVADLAVFPFQDVLNLGSEGRMNRPGEAAGNWDWRFAWDEVPSDSASRLLEMTELFSRAPRPAGSK